MAEFKNIKVRKDHFCNCCEGIIKKGNDAQVMKTRIPVFKDGEQTGIKYIRIYLHSDNFMCWDNHSFNVSEDCFTEINN